METEAALIVFTRWSVRRTGGLRRLAAAETSRGLCSDMVRLRPYWECRLLGRASWRVPSDLHLHHVAQAIDISDGVYARLTYGTIHRCWSL